MTHTTAETTPATTPETTVAAGQPERVATRRRYLMCRPDYFTVSYSISPWMDPSTPVDRQLAVWQWEALHDAYLELGHQVELVRAEAELPDMVFAANGGLVLGGRVLGARFRHAERRGEGPAYLRWFQRAVDWNVLAHAAVAKHTNEGEGDFLVVGRRIVAGHGFRSSAAAHAEVEEFFATPVISLRLVDPRYYHLDTALAVLDDTTIAYYPGAFSHGSQEVLAGLYPDAIIASAEDAAALGLNAVSDGHNVVLSTQATGLAQALREKGFNPVGVDLSELAKAGGGVKCCTLEVRA